MLLYNTLSASYPAGSWLAWERRVMSDWHSTCMTSSKCAGGCWGRRESGKVQKNKNKKDSELAWAQDQLGLRTIPAIPQVIERLMF